MSEPTDVGELNKEDNQTRASVRTVTQCDDDSDNSTRIDTQTILPVTWLPSVFRAGDT